MSIEEKQTIGKATNDLKASLTTAFDIRSETIDAQEVDRRLASEYTDVTFPIADTGIGHLHPLTQVMRQVEDSFTRMGFEIRESMEVTNEYKNFDAVNIPKTHPARDMQDTFWLE